MRRSVTASSVLVLMLVIGLALPGAALAGGYGTCEQTWDPERKHVEVRIGANQLTPAYYVREKLWGWEVFEHCPSLPERPLSVNVVSSSSFNMVLGDMYGSYLTTDDPRIDLTIDQRSAPGTPYVSVTVPGYKKELTKTRRIAIVPDGLDLNGDGTRDVTLLVPRVSVLAVFSDGAPHDVLLDARANPNTRYDEITISTGKANDHIRIINPGGDANAQTYLGNDTIHLTAKTSSAGAGYGNDTINTRNVTGDSNLSGGPGNDTILAGPGNDQVHGERESGLGNDRYILGAGNDELDDISGSTTSTADPGMTTSAGGHRVPTRYSLSSQAPAPPSLMLNSTERAPSVQDFARMSNQHRIPSQSGSVNRYAD